MVPIAIACILIHEKRTRCHHSTKRIRVQAKSDCSYAEFVVMVMLQDHCTAEAAPRRKRSRSQEDTPALNGDLKRQKSASIPRPGAILSPKSDLSPLTVSSNVPLHAHCMQAEPEPNFTTHLLTSSCDRRLYSCSCATSAAGVSTRFACQSGAHC